MTNYLNGFLNPLKPPELFFDLRLQIKYNFTLNEVNDLLQLI